MHYTALKFGDWDFVDALDRAMRIYAASLEITDLPARITDETAIALAQQIDRLASHTDRDRADMHRDVQSLLQEHYYPTLIVDNAELLRAIAKGRGDFNAFQPLISASIPGLDQAALATIPLWYKTSMILALLDLYSGDRHTPH